MNRDYLIKKGKEIKENGNMLGIKVTIPNQDEFIGFCGWADDNNTKPITDGFIEWCDYLKLKRVDEVI